MLAAIPTGTGGAEYTSSGKIKCDQRGGGTAQGAGNGHSGNTDKELRQATIEDCLAVMEKLPTALDAFDETAFHSLVDDITVYSTDDVRVMFKDGTEVQA